MLVLIACISASWSKAFGRLSLPIRGRGVIVTGVVTGVRVGVVAKYRAGD